MAILVELKAGERPKGRHALVISSSKLPAQGTSFSDHRMGRSFFANLDEKDIRIMVSRAMTWAKQRRIVHVYLRRDA